MQRPASVTPSQAKLATLSDLLTKQAWSKSARKSQIVAFLPQLQLQRQNGQQRKLPFALEFRNGTLICRFLLLNLDYIGKHFPVNNKPENVFLNFSKKDDWIGFTVFLEHTFPVLFLTG